ncbi:hypothetical protein EB796_003857 [Bugula neritina]|uniref:Transmembrane protein n=1 Tax=Bugula neritina TaxID=10212 RepID=A0A7J7KGN5_BUGNE|nr:hypothetical protein EB796_003857 [Bugula neritina]
MSLPQSRQASAGDNLTVGGLDLESWQVVIWVLAGAVGCGVLLALMAAYVNFRRERQQVQPTYTKSSVAIQRERLISTVKDFEFLQSVKEHQRRRSTVYQQFLASQRNARRFALAGTSMMAEFGSMLDNSAMGSMRSGVSQASTPDGTELALSALEQTGSESFDEVDSLQVELGEFDSDDDSVRSGVSYIHTPVGSLQ